MGLSSNPYPTRVKKSYWYLPFIPVGAVIFMCIGVGLWVHYTVLAYNNTAAVIQILNIQGEGSTNSNINRIFESLQATAVVYCIFSGLIIGLGSWRGMLEMDLDLSGRLHEYWPYFMAAMIVLQGSWWIIMVWLVLLIMGDGIFLSWLWITRQGLEATLIAQGNVGSSTFQYSSIYTCPATCFNANSYAFFGMSSYGGPNSGTFSSEGCICDPNTITAALSAVSTGYSATGGLMAGVWLMYICGNVLVYYMTSVMMTATKEQDVFERLSGVIQ
jgi:hypothetical protein